MNGRGHPLLNPAGFGQALHQPHPLIFLFLSLCGSTGAFCFLFGPITIFASAVARGVSASRSAPSPPSSSFWASTTASVLDPEWMLRLLRKSYKLGMYRKTLLGNKHCYVMPNTFLVILIKLHFFITFVPYCNCVWIFYNSI